MEHGPSKHRRNLVLGLGFLGLGALLAGLGIHAYRFHLGQLELRTQGLMDSILPLEEARFDSWLTEREADLAHYAKSPAARALLAGLARTPTDPGTRHRVSAWFAAAQTAHPEYRAVSVLRPDGRSLWASAGADSFGSAKAALAGIREAGRAACSPLQPIGARPMTLCSLDSGPAIVLFHVEVTSRVIPSLSELASPPSGAFDLYLARKTPEGAEALDHDPAGSGKMRLYSLPPDSAVARALGRGTLTRGQDHFGALVYALPASRDFLGWRPMGVREVGKTVSDSRLLALVFGLLGAAGIGGAFLLVGGLVRSAESEGARAVVLHDSLMTHAPDPVIITSAEAVILQVNPAACRLYGYSEEELVGRPLSILRLQGESPQAAERVGQTLKSGSTRFEAVHKTKDGSPIDVEVNASAVELDGERVVQGIVRDVTKNKSQLRRLERLSLLYAILAGCAKTISRASTRAELLREVVEALKALPSLVSVSFSRPDAGQGGMALEAGALSGAMGTESQIQRCHFLKEPVWDGPSSRPGVGSTISVPVFLGEELTCILNLASTEPDLFSGELRDLILGLARDVGAALARIHSAEEAHDAKQALGHNRRLLDKITQTLPTGIYIFDLVQGVNTFATPALERMLGFSEAEIRAAGPGFLPERLHPGDITTFTGASERLAGLKDGDIAVTHYRFRVKSGDFRWLRSRDTVFQRDEQGRPRLILGSIEDCTEEVVARETMAAALARSRMLTQAVENAAEGIVITDVGGIIQYFSPAAERTSGYTAAEAVGRHTRFLKSGKQEKAFYRSLWDTILRGQVWHGTFINKRKDGALVEEDASIAPVKDEAGRITNFVAVKRDVSRERSLEAQLTQAQKLEAVGRLAGGVAHDFNNILTSILGYAQLAKEELPQADPMRGDLEEIEKGAARAADLTRQLLIFSRKQVIKPRLIDPAAVAGALQKMLHRIIGEHYRLHFTAETSGRLIKSDPSQLEQIVMNFVVNSRDAMPGGGDIRVLLKDAVLDASLDGLDGPIPPGSYAALSVEDSGTGIPPAVREHIFEPFFTTKPAGQGTGLGLATVYGIVKQGGAFLTVDTAEGKGTCMTVYWPYSTEVPEPEPAGAEQSMGGSESILLVEDEGAVRRLTERLLAWAGYSVTSCAGPEEALAKAAESHVLLLTDVVMPGMSGKALAEQLRQRYPGLKVLYASGYSDEIISTQGMLEEGARLLQKPFTKESLFKAVRDTLDT